MKSSSDRLPDVVVLSNNKTQVRFNIHPVTYRSMGGEIRTRYDYDFVEIIGEPTKESIIEAILAADNPEPVIVPKEIEVKPVVDVGAVRIMATEAIAEATKRLTDAAAVTTEKIIVKGLEE